MESFLANLQHEVQCSLCNNSLTEPKLLQCFHTFCKPCIQRHAEPKGQDHIFKCPKCSSETLLQELCNVEDLQPSPLHSRMLQVLAFLESDKSCSVSATHSPALWQCFDCDRSLCDECLKSHATFTKDHKVYSFSDLKKEDLESMMKRESPCKSHLDHTLEFFCKDCDAMICLLCLRDDHKNHTIFTLQEVTAIEIDLISKNLEEIEKLRCNEMEKKQQQEIAVKMKSDGEKAKKEVKKLAKKLVKFLLDQEQELVNQIESSVAKADMNLRIIRHIPAVQQYMKNVLDNGIASDLLNDTTKVDYQPFDKEGIVFDRDEDWSQQVLNGKLGNVRLTSKSKPILSEIQVGSIFMALTKAKLSILTKNYRGEINYDDSDVVDIQISPVDDVKVKEKTVKTGGKIEVEFTPQVPGRLTAEVKLNGIPVSNSPLVMDVKPQHIEDIDEDSTLKQALNTGSGEFSGIAVNKTNSRIAVTDWHWSRCVRVFSMDGELLLMYDGKGSEQGQLSDPWGLAFLNDTDLVVVDQNHHRVCIVNTTTGTLVRTFGCRGNSNGEFNCPFGVHVDDDCNIIVSDGNNRRVQVFTKDGDYQYQFTVPNQDNFRPHSTVTHNGLFYVSDFNNGVIHGIQMNDGSPTLISTIGEKGDGVGQLQRPIGLAIDNDNHLLVCDDGSKVVNKFTLDGRFIGSTSKLNHNLQYIAVLNDGRFICTSRGGGKVQLFKNQQLLKEYFFAT